MFLRLLWRAPRMRRDGDVGCADVGLRMAGVASTSCAFGFRLSAFAICDPHLQSADSSARGIAFLPLRYGPVTLPRFLRDGVGRAAGDDFAAEAAGGGAEVEQAVGAGDDVAVVLDDQQRVAEVAELVQGGDQPRVVAGVEADRRFVEHVEHAAQAAADLAGEADALRLAAGERRRRCGRG